MPEHRGNIVIVEDDVGLNQALARLLQTAGFRTFSFDSAENLLANDAARNAGCFVIDVHLPGLSGVQLHQRLTAAGISCPIVFITAHDDLPTRQQVCGLGAYLVKPFSGQALILAIDDALRAAQTR